MDYEPGALSGVATRDDLAKVAGVDAKAFNIVASGFMDKAMFDFLAALDSNAGEILEASPRSVSLITDPNGTRVAEERCDEEGVLYAEIDVADCVAPKQFHDVSGGYNRFDIFQLTVNRTPNRPIQFANLSEQRPQSETNLENDHSTDPV